MIKKENIMDKLHDLIGIVTVIDDPRIDRTKLHSLTDIYLL